MKRRLSIPLKAMFLLVVFLLNTVVGFACAVGMEDRNTSNLDYHTVKDTHTHEHNGPDHKDLTDHHRSKKEKDHCCKDEVTKLLKEDKVSPSKITFSIQPVTFFTLLPTYCQLDVLASSVYQPSTKSFVRSYHPPIRDIRISIQSFQI
ncbi:HYC_CC_PP family protein [Pedobacter nyackensis]|uniref:Uncharacterized protein n=1 Tax=Pedobacter nyackensis TaxID=475255 RepID=A0A1W2A883_9SPHI|nr:hypothetical protein [Pedobacter nyackensis]SMC56867.1 hypothetical protein SAMN04488101_101302 [Pedobacter nyackensis]